MTALVAVNSDQQHATLGHAIDVEGLAAEVVAVGERGRQHRALDPIGMQPVGVVAVLVEPGRNLVDPLVDLGLEPAQRVADLG